MNAHVEPAVGPMLRRWRERRRRSQLEVALSAGVSARHVSFVETGRSQPSVSMILRLAEELDVPIRDRNALLVAAGYAPVYSEVSLHDPDMAAFREAIDRLLRAYEPYPALVLDGAYDVVATNATVDVLLDGIADSLLERPMNTIRLALHPEGLAPRIANFASVRRHMLGRIRRHLESRPSHRLCMLYDEVSGYPTREDEGNEGPPVAGTEADFALPMRLRHGGTELAFISAVATFNTPLDVTVSELAIETFLPADPATAEALREL